MLEIKADDEATTKIGIVGIGGGGNNAINRIIESGISGVDLIALNTDKDALRNSNAQRAIQIGARLTKGQGCGANPEKGAAAANESIQEIQEAIKDLDMVFLTCGMGGGTGTGAIPIVAKSAKEMGILTVGVVTKPFDFEGIARKRNAGVGIEELKEYVDTLIIIPNQKLMDISNKKMSIKDGFKKVDEVLHNAIVGVVNLITHAGAINVDFADVRTVMEDKGVAHIGLGVGKGENKEIDAIKLAVDSPLLETKISGAQHLLLNFVGSNLGINAVEDAIKYLNEHSGTPIDNVIWGVDYETTLGEDECSVLLIATGNLMQKDALKIAPSRLRDTAAWAKGGKAPMPQHLRTDAQAPLRPLTAERQQGIGERPNIPTMGQERPAIMPQRKPEIPKFLQRPTDPDKNKK